MGFRKDQTLVIKTGKMRNYYVKYVRPFLYKKTQLHEVRVCATGDVLVYPADSLSIL